MAFAHINEPKEVGDLSSKQREGVLQDVSVRTTLRRNQECLRAARTGDKFGFTRVATSYKGAEASTDG